MGVFAGGLAVLNAATSTDADRGPDPSEASRLAQAIGPIPVPSDCPFAIDDPDLLPNAVRPYRSGLHQGVDFVCYELGHEAVAPMAGRVLLATRGYLEPGPAERRQILSDAKALGETPPWTLAMLYGRFVVIDHGVIADAGHVVTIYAHLADIDPAVRPGASIDVGDPIGAIGNSGTQAGGTGVDAPSSYQLHWELHVDDVFLGAGADAELTRRVYETLFDS